MSSSVTDTACHALVPSNCRTIKKARDDFVKRLNGIYANNMIKDNVEYIPGHAQFVSPTEVQVDGHTLTARHILIATGTKPRFPADIPGESTDHTNNTVGPGTAVLCTGSELGISSDGFFALEDLPK